MVKLNNILARYRATKDLVLHVKSKKPFHAIVANMRRKLHVQIRSFRSKAMGAGAKKSRHGSVSTNVLISVGGNSNVEFMNVRSNVIHKTPKRWNVLDHQKESSFVPAVGPTSAILATVGHVKIQYPLAPKSARKRSLVVTFVNQIVISATVLDANSSFL